MIFNNHVKARSRTSGAHANRNRNRGRSDGHFLRLGRTGGQNNITSSIKMAARHSNPCCMLTDGQIRISVRFIRISVRFIQSTIPTDFTGRKAHTNRTCARNKASGNSDGGRNDLGF